jgi:type I restriction enzyme S subunit
VPFYRSKEIIQRHNQELINTELFISEDRFTQINESFGVPQEGDMLMTSVGTLGVPYIVRGNDRFYFKDGNLTWYKEFSDELNSKYLFYLMDSTKGKELIKTVTIGSSQAALTIDGMKSLMIPCPSRKEQDNIVDILTTYDNLIHNNNYRIAVLEEMAQRLYREWFVHFRFPGHEKTDMVESELGLIPDGWHVKTPKQLSVHYIGGGWGKETSNDNLKPAYVIRGADIPKARKNDVSGCPLRFHTQSNLKERVLAHGDLVIEVSGGSKGQPVGRPLLITRELLGSFEPTQAICASFCKLYRCDSTVVSPYYLFMWLIEIYRNGEIERYQSQSTGIINFQFEYFLDSPVVIVPSEEVQGQFTKQVEPLYKQISKLGRKNSILRKTRDMLLPRLLSGDIDVSSIDFPLQRRHTYD